VAVPLAAPGMAVTALWGFLTGWSEFILAWTFLTVPLFFVLQRHLVAGLAAGGVKG
jgi:ABC-type maltose transport system permease subunit